MNTASIFFIAVVTLAFGGITAVDQRKETGFLMWFMRGIAVASAIASATCLGLVIWRLAA